MGSNFDVITFGEAMVMFIAEEEKPLEAVKYFSRGIAGAELNVSTGLTRLGFNVGWFSKIGNDSFGRAILNYLSEERINSNFVIIDNNKKTGFQLKSKLKNNNGDPEVEYFRKNSAAAGLSISDLNKHNIKAKCLHITGIGPALSDSCFEVAEYLINHIKEQHGIVVFDPNIRPILWENKNIMVEKLNYLASMSDIVLPGINEGQILTNYSSCEDIANFYLNNGANKVIIKLGKDGAYFKDFSGEYGVVPSLAVHHIVDTVGAGDAFAVGVVSALLENKSLIQAVKRGNLLGSLAVQVAGDNEGLPTRKQLLQYEMEGLC